MQTPNPNNDHDIKFKCEMHWSQGERKGIFPKFRSKSVKPSCCIDLDITQKDQTSTSFISDVIGTEAHKPK